MAVTVGRPVPTGAGTRSTAAITAALLPQLTFGSLIAVAGITSAAGTVALSTAGPDIERSATRVSTSDAAAVTTTAATMASISQNWAFWTRLSVISAIV